MYSTSIMIYIFKISNSFKITTKQTLVGACWSNQKSLSVLEDKYWPE